MRAVIGGGPAGCFYAAREQQEEVHIFEKEKKIGSPIACTGIITDSVKQFVDIPEEIKVAEIKQFKMISPNKEALYVDLKKTNHVFHRGKFDQYIASLAKENGAKIHLNEAFKGYKKTEHGYRIKTTKGSYDTSMIVGADGPKSPVAQAADFYAPRRFVQGWQARCKFPDIEYGVSEVHLNLGEFSWVVPEDDNIARVGVIGVDSAKLKKDYQKLLGASKIIEDQSGIIPLYNPKQKIRKQKEDIFLIGDAATHVKATTYGGILYGMIGADYLAQDKESFIKNIDKKLSKDLWLSLQMRELMNNMTDKQANELIETFQKESNNTMLAEHDRNFPSKFVLQLLMKETKLWKLGLGMMKNKMFSCSQHV